MSGASAPGCRKATRVNFDAKAGVGAHVVKRAQHHGAILRNMAGDVIAFSPPLIIKEQEIDALLERVKWALDDTLAMVRGRGFPG